MRRVLLKLDEFLAAGLDRETTGVNTPALTTCINAIPFDGGVRKADSITALFTPLQLTTAGITSEWPYIQSFLIGDEGSGTVVPTLLTLTDEKAYVSSNLTEKKIYNVDTGEEDTLLPGRDWDVINLGIDFIAVNGACCLFSENGEFYVKKSLTVNSACMFKGRVVYAGVSGTHPLWGTLKPNSIVFTTIGGGDLLWIFDSNKVTGLREPVINMNDSGYIVIPDVSVIYKVISMRDCVMAYTDNGIYKLTPFSSPIPSFGIEKLVAINCLFAGGTTDRHIMIDESAAIWEVLPDKVTHIGFSHHLPPMGVNTRILINTDESTGNTYIMCSLYTFVLTPDNKLAKITRVFAGLFSQYGRLYSASVVSTTPTVFEIETNGTNCDVAGMKHVDFAIPVCRSVSDMTIKGKAVIKGNTFSGKEISADTYRASRINITGSILSIYLKGTFTANYSNVSGLAIEWMLVDDRFNRTLYGEESQ